MEFKVEFNEGYDDPYFVKADDGWFFPVSSEKQAEALCVKLNELVKPKDELLTIDDYFKEWEMNINELNDKKKDIMDLKGTYAKLEGKLLAEAKEINDKTGEDIIKAKYGGNSDKTRKKYTDEELKEEKQQIKDLELRIEHLTRRNQYICEMMAMQRTLISSGVLENEL